jgi:hypothetical protein
MKTMRPTYLLWIAFGAAVSAWYALDPAARRLGDELAKASPAKVQQIVLEATRGTGVTTAAL